jgi:hypothetical protein
MNALLKKMADSFKRPDPDGRTRTKGATRKELMAQVAVGLLPDEKRKWSKILDSHPAINAERQYFTPEEIRIMLKSPTMVRDAEKTLKAMPKAKDMGSVMQLGQSKLGWYEQSAKAIEEAFGKEDAPIFARILAATSPQTTVDKNLQHSLKFWEAWTAANRPTDEKSIKAIRKRTGGMETYDNNLINAVKGAVLSGPKVNSFGRNLQNLAMFVTNDVWNAKGMGIEQTNFAGVKPKGNPDNPGYSGGYLAANARVRNAADQFGWTPAEGQETYWSTLYTLGQKGGVLENLGRKTHQDVGGTPDFAQLLRNPKYAALAPSMSEKFAKITPSPRQIDDIPLMEGLTPQDIARAQRGGLTNLQRDKDAALMETRQRSYGQGTTPALDQRIAPATMHHEGVPYAHAGLGGDLEKDTEKALHLFSKKVTEPFIDAFGNDRLLAAMGIDTQLRRQYGQGAYQPPDADLEANPVAVTGTMLDLTKQRQPRARDVQAFDTVSKIKSSMTAQGASPYSIPILDPEGDALYRPRGKQSDGPWKDNIRAQAMQNAGKDLAVADMGRGSLRLGFGDDSVYDMPRPIDTELKHFPNAGALLPDMPPGPMDSIHGVPVRNAGGYPSFEDEWTKPQQNLISNQVLQAYEALPMKTRRALDAEIQDIAPQLLDAYQKKKVKREDFLRYLHLMKEGGLPAVREAIEAGEKLIQAPTGSNPFGGYA